jgi:hypothetical protein
VCVVWSVLYSKKPDRREMSLRPTVISNNSNNWHTQHTERGPAKGSSLQIQ